MNGLSFVSLGDIELDERQRLLTRRGVTIDLTGAEFSLLRLLIFSPRNYFLQAGFDPPSVKPAGIRIDRSIDSLVSNLRRKLGPSPDGSERIRSVSRRRDTSMWSQKRMQDDYLPAKLSYLLDRNGAHHLDNPSVSC